MEFLMAIKYDKKLWRELMCIFIVCILCSIFCGKKWWRGCISMAYPAEGSFHTVPLIKRSGGSIGLSVHRPTLFVFLCFYIFVLFVFLYDSINQRQGWLH